MSDERTTIATTKGVRRELRELSALLDLTMEDTLARVVGDALRHARAGGELGAAEGVVPGTSAASPSSP